MSNHQLLTFPGDDALAVAAASRWLDEIATTPTGSPFCVALSGGRIARKFFAAVVKGATERAATWANVHFFWADERCVPPADPDSNFALAKLHLLDPLRIQPDKIHRLRGEVSPDRAVVEAEAEICRIAPLDGTGQPVLDLVLLGMGEDGHVASLFPGAGEEVVRSRRVYLPVTAAKPPPQRMTMGYPALAAAKQVWVLVSGDGKEKALRESLSGNGITPLARVLAARERTLVFSGVRISPAG